MDKKTVRRVVIIALAVLLVEQIFFLICGFGLPAQYGDTFMGELKSKYERLKETPGQRIVLAGGSGVAFDWQATHQLIGRPQQKFFVAGGLNAANVADSIRILRPDGVDVSGGVETDGIKDPAKIRQFIAAARAAERNHLC